MPKILITGSAGFMGQHLCVALRRKSIGEVLEFDVHQAVAELPIMAKQADLVFHLAGVNRPKDEQDFVTGNADLTRQVCDALAATGRRTPLVLSSSTQAEFDNPYGRSKKAAEEVVLSYHQATGADVCIYRFPNVFGKWSRPNYNTVVATFCYNISRGMPIHISNRANVIRFVYIDDVIQTFLDLIPELSNPDSHFPSASSYGEVQPVFSITLGELHDLLVSFRENRTRSLLSDLSNPLVKYLYSTYISFYDTQDFAYPVELKTDNRGWLFELIKSPHAGQIFVSRTHPGITRGNHYHDTKIEKFCVIQGEGVIRFRHVLVEEQSAKGEGEGGKANTEHPTVEPQRSEVRAQRPEDIKCEHRTSNIEPPTSNEGVIEYRVSDREIQIVDIPPGYTHSIENTGTTDMLTIFWANEIFDPQKPDTYAMPVLNRE